MKTNRFNYLKTLILVLGLLGLLTAVRAQQSDFYFYDRNGRLQAVFYTSGEVIVYEYDPAGNFTDFRKLNPNSFGITGVYFKIRFTGKCGKI